MMGVANDYKAAVLPPAIRADTVMADHSSGKGKTMTDPRMQRIAGLLTLKADGQYGLSDINQRQHALQSAWLAEGLGCAEPLIVASLLHDIGHMVHDLGDSPAEAGIDDRHEERGHEFLRAWFGPEVTEPVRLHVAAKRYLCATEADYFSRLSKDSVLSLSLQGGPMSPEEVAAFHALPGSAEAVQLRRFDEQAKVKDLETPPVDHFMHYVGRCILPL
jgi:[1-hydroxy-2-(trimethylamino)ethyl]phosphonate dioxygenase